MGIIHLTEEIQQDVEPQVTPVEPIVEAPVSAPEPVKSPEIAPEKETQRDKARSAVADAIKQLKGDEPKSDRQRDETGKFVPVSAPKVEAPKESPTTENVTKASVEPPKAPDAPPVSWTADAKTDWTNASPALKAAVLKREQEVSQGFAQYSEKTRQYEQVLSPLVQETQKLGIDPGEGLQQLLTAHHALNSDPQSAIMELARQYKVDLAELVSNPPAQRRNDPAFSQVTHEVNSLKNQLDAIKQERVSGFVEEFASKNPHFNDVADDIQRFIPEIRYSNPGASEKQILQEAYDRATWLNPNVREKLIAEKTPSIAPVQQKAVQAQKAAVSIRGSSAGGVEIAQGEKRYKTTHDAARAAIQSLRNA